MCKPTLTPSSCLLLPWEERGKLERGKSGRGKSVGRGGVSVRGPFPPPLLRRRNIAAFLFL